MKHGYTYISTLVAVLLLTLLVGLARESQGQYYYQSPCQNGQCPPQQYQQPQYQQPRYVQVQPQQPASPEVQASESDCKIHCEVNRGSGTVIAPASGGCYVTTNYHVIKNQNSITVYNGSGQSAQASVAASDEGEDVAILFVNQQWQHVSIGEDVSGGQPVDYRAYDSGARFRIYSGRIVNEYTREDGSPGWFATGHSVPGNSGGGVYHRGLYVGMVWGNPGGQSAIIRCSVIRRILDRLRGQQPSSNLVPLPDRDSQQQCPCPCDCDEELTSIREILVAQKNLAEKMVAVAEKHEERIVLLETRQAEPGPAGPAGPQGIQGEQGTPGKDATVDENALAERITQAVLAKIEIPEPVNPPSAAKHYVLVADAEADYWPRMAPELKRAQEGYSKIKLAPPPSYSVGALPQMVEYLSGVPQRTIAGTHNVSAALAKLSQGETP